MTTTTGTASPAARDAVLTAAVAALTAVALPAVVLLGAASGETVPGTGATAVLTAVCVVQCLPLVVRRSRPVACLLLVAALQVAVVAAASPDDVGARGAAPLLAAYAVGSLLPERRAARVVPAAVLLELVGTLAVTVPTGGVGTGLVGVVGGAVTYVAAALVGAHVATRRRYAELERRRAAEAVAAQEDRVRSAVAEVRAGMARELHDIAAHHLSAMVVQATAASRLVERDPAAAREGLLAIRAQGRRTLEDLRMLVGVLRDPDSAEDGAPVPGLGVLDGLVEQARTLGDDVVVRRAQGTEHGAGLAPLADVTAYRAVQEALSNARQHAPGAPVVVDVARGDERVVVTVENEPAPAPPPDGGPAGRRAGEGVGLLGMRERVQLVGGRLDVGPTPAGGWRVRVELPVDAPAGEHEREQEGER
ncbi:sensor histidine kinase [Nocardioides zeae]|uniref:histidine kinase n=1 Tax=Nocardioides zeae TaxID=1457234 RepID=A0A6P0HKL7_9ACTN|nr:histidine kinase [Nocardioides zeae]NEN79222.1 two-component sensor histidine kinase [Nocardioides zeae]